MSWHRWRPDRGELPNLPSYDYDPRMGLPHRWFGVEHRGHPGEGCYPASRFEADTAPGEAEYGEKEYQEAAMWAYQFAGALTVAYDFKEGDIVPLLDVLSALAEGEPPTVEWPAVVPSYRAALAAPSRDAGPSRRTVEIVAEAMHAGRITGCAFTGGKQACSPADHIPDAESYLRERRAPFLTDGAPFPAGVNRADSEGGGEVSYGTYLPNPHNDPLWEVIADEVDKARARFAPFNSPHEGYAVIAEELDELWDHVKANTGRSVAARREAVQIAAMAVRYLIDLDSEGER